MTGKSFPQSTLWCESFQQKVRENNFQTATCCKMTFMPFMAAINIPRNNDRIKLLDNLLYFGSIVKLFFIHLRWMFQRNPKEAPILLKIWISKKLTTKTMNQPTQLLIKIDENALRHYLLHHFVTKMIQNEIKKPKLRMFVYISHAHA